MSLRQPAWENLTHSLFKIYQHIFVQFTQYMLEQIEFATYWNRSSLHYMLKQKQVFEASALTRSLKGHASVFEPAAPLNKIVNLCLQICLID